MQLNKNIVELANFLFRIKKITFIKSLILNTPIEFIIFYIIPINIPLLLYPADINKIVAFFNNIIN